jgi:hypothetical protein
MTATALPGFFVALFMGISMVGAATAVSLFTIVKLFLLVGMCVSAPLVFVGCALGFRARKIEVPTKTNPIARIVPTGPNHVDQRIVEVAGEERVVRPVDRIAALEGQNVLVRRQTGPDFLRRFARNFAHELVQPRDRAAHVQVLAAFGSNHERAGVFNFQPAFSTFAFHRLAGQILVSEFDRGKRGRSPCESKMVAHGCKSSRACQTSRGLSRARAKSS